MQEVMQEAGAAFAGAFGVKLHAVEVVLLHGGGKGAAVVGFAAGVGADGDAVAVDEVEMAILRDAFK